MLKYVRKTSAKIVFFSEITNKQHGILWIKARELYGVVIYGNKVAIFLRDDWADDWEKQGCQRWVSERVVAVKVKKHRLVACYQPICGKHEEDMRKYRENLEEQLALKRRNEWLIIGGDFNAQVGSRELRVETETCGRFGIGKMNDAGRDLISWMEINGLCWINSYFDHPDRGTWYNKRNNSWHEIDGFIGTKDERIKRVRRIATDSEFTLSDHKPKTMTIIDEGPKCKKSKERRYVRKIDWQKLENRSMKLYTK